jgi:enoyl-[acyl-carrier protein] reductase II
MVQIAAVAQAIRAAERGADVIIAQGGEAGGYGGSISTMVLVAQVVVEKSIPRRPIGSATSLADSVRDSR